jgi:hypothetical protein
MLRLVLKCFWPLPVLISTGYDKKLELHCDWAQKNLVE